MSRTNILGLLGTSGRRKSLRVWPIFSLAVILVVLIGTSLASAASITKTLAWDANTETDLAGYRLYQSNVIGGPYTFKINIAKTASTYAATLTATVPTDFCWVLTAYDTAGNESGYSNEVCFRYDPDITPPAAPKAFRLAP